MSAAYREVVESYSNDNILINVVRASQKMPVSFLDIPSIMGTGNVSASAGVSSTVYSANPGSFAGFLQPWSGAVGLANYIPNASMSVSGGYTFTQSSLDNATFMKPFLSAIKIGASLIAPSVPTRTGVWAFATCAIMQDGRAAKPSQIDAITNLRTCMDVLSWNS
jgi:hypothetical protein